MDGETSTASTVNVVLLIARTKVINHFAGEYFFLSNFYPCRVAFYGMCFPSVEAAFQAAKCAAPTTKLLDTDGAVLVEGNAWHDNY